MRYIILIYILYGSLSFQLFAQKTHTVEIRISPITSEKGNLLIGIYDNTSKAFNFSGKQRGVIIAPTKGVQTVKVNLQRGIYAIGVIHDLNKNGTLDKNLIGLPKEPYGLSSEASRPIFKDASFLLQNDTIIQIHLKH